MAGQVHPLVHPDFVVVVTRVGVLAELPVDAPAGVGAVDDVHEPLALARVVAVVVDRDEVAVRVPVKFVGVAQAVGEDLEVGPIRVAADDDAVVVVFVYGSVLVRYVATDVADGPPKPSLRTDFHPTHPMTVKANVDHPAAADGFFSVGRTVAVGVTQAPHIRRYANVNITVVVSHAVSHVGDFRMKIFHVAAGAVGNAVVVFVGDVPDAFLFYGQVAPVEGVVFIVVGQGGFARCAAGAEVAVEEIAAVFRALPAQGFFGPVHVTTHVEFRGGLAVGAGVEQAAVGGEAEGDGVLDEAIGGVEGEGQAVGYGGA